MAADLRGRRPADRALARARRLPEAAGALTRVARASRALLGVALIAIVALEAPPAAAAAPPDDGPGPLSLALRERLASAESAFQVQNYPQVIELLQPLTDPRYREFQQRQEYRQVLEWLGASQWLTGNRERALQATFTDLLVRWPRHTLDELVYPTELLRDFARQREFLIRYGVIDPFGTSDATTVSVLVRELEVDDAPTIAYFAPFGVGQFVNGDDGKGMVVAVLQAIGVITTAATWFGVESLKDERGVVQPDDEGTATALRTLWYAGATVFVGSYVYGVTDGLVSRDATPRVRYRRERIDRESIPDDVLLPDRASFGITPLDGGVGATMQGTF